MGVYIEPSLIDRRNQYSFKEQLARCFWGVGAVILKMIPRPCHRSKCFLLRIFGAKIGPYCTVASTARIFFPWNLEMGAHCAIGDWATIYNLGKLHMGDSVVVSHQAHLCGGSHDYKEKSFPLVKASIILEDEVWICADAFIGPGVTIGRGSIVGARSVVLKNVDSRQIIGGNPAKLIKERELNL